MSYYKRYYKVKTADHNDWYIQVDTTTGASAGDWSVKYIYKPDEPEVTKEHLPEELFEI